MAYGNPVNARPQRAGDHDEDEQAGHAGLGSHADDEPEHEHRDAECRHEQQVGDHQAEQQRDSAYRSEQQPVEVAVLDVGHERRRSGHAGHREDDRERELERLVVDARCCFGRTRFAACPMFTTKKNTGMIRAGMTASWLARHDAQRPARDRPQVGEEPASRARICVAGTARSARGRRSSVLLRRFVLDARRR